MRGSKVTFGMKGEATEAPTDNTASKQIRGKQFNPPDLNWTDLNSK